MRNNLDGKKRGRGGMAPKSALLTAKGYLRISADLLPSLPKSKQLYFFQMGLPRTKQIGICPVVNGAKGPWQKRKAIYGNHAAKSPTTSVKALMKFMGIQLPRESEEKPVRKRKDGWILVQL